MGPECWRVARRPADLIVTWLESGQAAYRRIGLDEHKEDRSWAS